MTKNLKLYSLQLSASGPTAIKPARYPVDFLMRVYGEAKRQGVSAHQLLVRSAQIGFEQLEKKEEKVNVP